MHKRKVEKVVLRTTDPRGQSSESWPVVITIFSRAVCTFQNLAKQNKVRERIVIATGVNLGLAEWIIDGTRVLVFSKYFFILLLLSTKRIELFLEKF